MAARICAPDSWAQSVVMMTASGLTVRSSATASATFCSLAEPVRLRMTALAWETWSL